VTKVSRFILLLLVLMPASALAQFEGIIEMKMTTKDGSGTGKTYVAKVGSRSEIAFQSPKLQPLTSGPFRMITIQKFNEPDLVYHLNDERKTYSIINLKQAHEQAGKLSEETYTVKRIGSDTIVGYTCEKALLTSQGGRETEICVSKDISGMSAWLAMMERAAMAKGGRFKALKEAELEGLPVRMITHGKEGTPVVTIEVVRAERQSLSPALFEVPSDYKKEAAGMSFLTSEMQQKVREAMEKIRPEQRKMLEQLMK